MRWPTQTIIGLLGCLALILGLSRPLDAAREADTADIAPPNTVFEEIELSAEGVYAYDTSGNRWVYDFEVEAFVPGDLTSGEYDGGTPEQEVPPVEERCTEERKIKPYQRTVLIGWDEYVNGDIVAGGRVTVRGWVKGAIQSYGGRVLVTNSGQVDGDIRAPEIDIKEGGRVLGETTITDPVLEIPRDVISYSFSSGGLWVVFSFTVFLLLVGFAATTLMPRQLDRFNRCVADYPVRSFVMGLLATVLMVPIMVLLIVTLFGILIVVLVPIAYLLAFTLGVISFSHIVGSRVMARVSRTRKHESLNFAAGLALIMLLWFVVAILLGSADSISNDFGIFFLVIAILVTTFPVCTGAGAALLTRFGFREYTTSLDERLRGADARPPAPTPPPPAPPPIRRTPGDSPHPRTGSIIGDEEDDYEEDDEFDERPPGKPPLPPDGKL
jgi:uncharacterized membrane protein